MTLYITVEIPPSRVVYVQRRAVAGSVTAAPSWGGIYVVGGGLGGVRARACVRACGHVFALTFPLPFLLPVCVRVCTSLFLYVCMYVSSDLSLLLNSTSGMFLSVDYVRAWTHNKPWNFRPCPCMHPCAYVCVCARASSQPLIASHQTPEIVTFDRRGPSCGADVYA